MRTLACFALLPAVAAAAIVLAIVARPDVLAFPQSAHGKQLPAAEVTRLARATQAVSSSASQAELAAEGQRVFNSNELALTGEACGGCHTMNGANAELGTIKHPVKENDFTGPRDPPVVFGIADTAPYGWAGDVPTLTQFAINAVRFHFKPEEIDTDEKVARHAAAIVAFLERAQPPLSDFDRGTLSDAARRGEEVFENQGGCIGCHGGPLLTDNALHTIIPKADPDVRKGDGQGNADCGATNPGCDEQDPLFATFNTPTLRNLVDSAPYFHDGRFQTLQEVVQFYNASSAIAPLSLNGQQIDDLVEYLKSL